MNKLIKSALIGVIVVVVLALLIINSGEDKITQETTTLAGYDQLLVLVSESDSSEDGNIIVIKDEDHKWGKMEKIKFLIVRISKLTEEEKAIFLSASEGGERLYKVDYPRFLTEGEMARLREKKETFSLSRGQNVANVFIAVTGEQYPVINKSDIVMR